MGGPPVTIVDAGGIAMTNVASGGTPFTPVDAGGIAVTLVDSGGLPVTLINQDGSLWSGGGAPVGFGFLILNSKTLQLNGNNLMLRNT